MACDNESIFDPIFCRKYIVTTNLNMAGKKNNTKKTVKSDKKRDSISFETKQAIIRKVQAGEKVAAIARDMGKNRSTIATIWSDRKRILKHIDSVVPMKSTIISKRRGQALEQTEKMLVQWLEDKQARRMPVSFGLIQEKATSLFEDIKAKQGEGSNEEPFVASHGWFHRFKKRANLHHVKIAGEAASADKMAAEAFPAEFKKILDEGGYSPKQVFNVDETALFWKKMPDRSYISKEEKSLPGYKVAKERITLRVLSHEGTSPRPKFSFFKVWLNISLTIRRNVYNTKIIIKDHSDSDRSK